LDFDLPRFGVSLVTIAPAGDGGDAGADGSMSPPGPRGGCACRLVDGGGASDAAALLATGGLVILLAIRRRRAGARAREPVKTIQ